MNFLNRCTGRGMKSRQLTDVEEREIERVFEDCKQKYAEYAQFDEYGTNHSKRLHDGVRFNIETVKEILAEKKILDSGFLVEEWVLDALDFCAGADYYYYYEKDY